MVSGGFDPIHIGHIRLFEKARALGDELVVILNNDNWLKKKKGFFFMPEADRREIIKGLACVDRVALTRHPENPTDMSVCAELKRIRPDIFVNGGDRTRTNIPEVPVCDEIGCTMMFGVGGGKVRSSSWFLDDYKKMCVRDYCCCAGGWSCRTCVGLARRSSGDKRNEGGSP